MHYSVMLYTPFKDSQFSVAYKKSLMVGKDCDWLHYVNYNVL